jgi:7-alpha-hydroxysteroid dehydrogenase
MSFSIAGKTAIVTGAAHGVGLAIARRFLDEGANVMFADRDEDRLADELGEAGGEGAARMFACNLCERLSLANLLSATIVAFDRVDILVNASRQVLLSDPLDRADASLSSMLEQNLTPAFRLSQLVAGRMIQQAAEAEDTDAPAGAIVNLSSIAAQRTRPDLLAYSVASAAIEQMTRSLALALAAQRIRVNAIAFGSVMSESLKEMLRDDPALRDRIVQATPLGRIAAPGAVADAAQFLASDGAGFVTGAVLRVDGGRSILDAAGTSGY